MQNTRWRISTHHLRFGFAHADAVQTIAILFAFAVVGTASPALAGERTCYEFEVVNVPGDDGNVHPGTTWWGVNNRNQFSGDYCADEECTESRAAIYDARDGSIITFAIDGYTANIDSPRINDRGDVVGSAWSEDSNWVTWVRKANGTILKLEHLVGFVGLDINNRGKIAGVFIGEQGFRGALVSGKDYTNVEYYGLCASDGTPVENGVWGINESGDLIVTWEGLNVPGGYLTGIDRGHRIDWYNWTEYGFDAGTAWAMNNRGTVVGGMLDFETGDHPGFVDRNGDMQLIRIDDGWTHILDINDHDVLAATTAGYNEGVIGWPKSCRAHRTRR